MCGDPQVGLAGRSRIATIGLTPEYLLGWQGARDLFQHITLCLLAAADDDRIEIALGRDNPGPLRRIVRGVRGALGTPPPTYAVTLAQVRELVGVEMPIGDGHSADVIGPFSTHQSKSQATPWIGYISDLQHRRMPELFSAAERKARDRQFRSLLATAPVVLVHSRAVRDDIVREFDSRTRIVVIPFAPCPEPWWFDDDPTILSRYRIEPPFFMCSNQFWKHKDHHVLFAAVAQAHRDGAPVRLVCTGATHDYRHPNHFGQLQREITDAGIAGDVSILGLIPKADQLALMRQATAILQPSRFEGSPGGGSVHQAIALGKQTIVADLPVNREISGFEAAFFEPGNADMLLSRMRSVTLPTAAATRESLLSAGLNRRRLAGQVIKAAFLSAR